MSDTTSQPPEASSYQPLTFKSLPEEDRKNIARKIAKDWLDFFTKQNLSISKWRRHAPITLEGKDNQGKPCTAVVTFNKISELILSVNDFTVDMLGIYNENYLPWPDGSASLSMNHYWVGQAVSLRAQRISLASANIKNFPLVPSIDREGIAFNPLHPHLVAMIRDSRARLVNNSASMFKVNPAWLQDLILYFNCSVSIVEAWLTQIYYKAKYDPVPAGLKFDISKMGEIYNRRLMDKISWIKHTTGIPLDDAAKEIRTFSALKDIRNHLNHFDPPVFAATIEDIAEWLNMIFSVAKLLWKIRRTLKLPPDRTVIQLILQDRVEFVPQNPSQIRLPQTAGYASCKWSPG